ncbi:General transcription factor 3C polypeptide 2 [Melia azedarach]|uniref:General transcription factor 3C polypeptide 2 n=1 Tax=Melia azedarach TaxID=155640 RepID=A0ACC1XZA3_MELAZ|nr:General transcription factor 3C polypeptide 2 [Melia azedarach]
MWSLLAESTPAKSSNDKKGTKALGSDNQTFSPLLQQRSSGESDAHKTLEAIKKKREPKSGSSNKKKAKDNRSLVCVDEEETMNLQEKGNEKGEADVLPPKLVAMHQVRWNMNKGSERWLCYGGAAGIVRCLDLHKKMDS